MRIHIGDGDIASAAIIRGAIRNAPLSHSNTIISQRNAIPFFQTSTLTDIFGLHYDRMKYFACVMRMTGTGSTMAAIRFDLDALLNKGGMAMLCIEILGDRVSKSTLEE
jgi:hypothetical protein